MAGFRIGRGRDNRTPQQQPQRQQPYGRQAPPPSSRGGQQPRAAQQQWPPSGGQYGSGPARAGAPYPGGRPNGTYGGGQEEPEYFGDPHQAQSGAQADPYANSAGHTQMFSIDDAPYDGAGDYQGGGAVRTGPRLSPTELLSGIVLRPGPTFLQMRDYPVWGTALVVTFVYGLLALFGFNAAREEAMDAAISTVIPYMLTTAVSFIIGGLILGAVTHTLARQLGGDGAWQPTIGLAMLIMTITDAPRLLFGMFLGGDNGFVQVLGWVTWIAAGALFTSMVSKSHDLPWQKALGASSIQLIALLSLIKLGTL